MIIQNGSGRILVRGLAFMVLLFFFFPALAFPQAKKPDKVESLIQQLQNAKSSSWDRQNAANELGRMGDPRAVGPLLKAMEDFFVRGAAESALEKIVDYRAVGALLEGVKSKEARVRGAAEGALNKIRDPRAVGPLLQGLGSKDIEVQRAAERALMENIKDPRAAGPLLECVKHKNSEVRKAAKGLLYNIKDPAAVKYFIEGLRDKNDEVRSEAARGLIRIGKPSVEPLLVLFTDQKQEPAIRAESALALGEIRDVRALGPFITALKSDQNENMRIAAVMGLDRLKDPGVLQPLIAALEDKSLKVRKAAANALVKWPQAVEALNGLLKDENLEIVVDIYPFYLRNGGAVARPTLISALNKHGNSRMAEDFLNSGESPLEMAARSWAEKNNFEVVKDISKLTLSPRGTVESEGGNCCCLMP